VGDGIGRPGGTGGGGDGRGMGRPLSGYSFLFFCPHTNVQGSHTPNFARSAPLRWGISLSRLRVGTARPHRLLCPKPVSAYLFGMKDGKRESNK